MCLVGYLHNELVSKGDRVVNAPRNLYFTDAIRSFTPNSLRKLAWERLLVQSEVIWTVYNFYNYTAKERDIRVSMNFLIIVWNESRKARTELWRNKWIFFTFYPLNLHVPILRESFRLWIFLITKITAYPYAEWIMLLRVWFPEIAINWILYFQLQDF